MEFWRNLMGIVFSQLADTDTEMHLHVNHKTVLGTTETLGQVVLPLESMARYQPPAWFRLTKKHSEHKDRGQIQLEYQFSNKIGSSISNFSLNKIEKGWSFFEFSLYFFACL